MVISSDSQAAIQAVQNPKRSSGQYVLTNIYNHVRALRSRTPTFDQIRVEIRWIPAHLGVLAMKPPTLKRSWRCPEFGASFALFFHIKVS